MDYTVFAQQGWEETDPHPHRLAPARLVCSLQATHPFPSPCWSHSSGGCTQLGDLPPILAALSSVTVSLPNKLISSITQVPVSGCCLWGSNSPSAPQTFLHQSPDWAASTQAPELGLELEPASQPCSQNHNPRPRLSAPLTPLNPAPPLQALRQGSASAPRDGMQNLPLCLQDPLLPFILLTVCSRDPLSGSW